MEQIGELFPETIRKSRDRASASSEQQEAPIAAETVPPASFRDCLGVFMEAHAAFIKIYLQMLDVALDEETDDGEKARRIQGFAGQEAEAQRGLALSTHHADMAAATPAEKALLEKTKFALFQSGVETLQLSGQVIRN